MKKIKILYVVPNLRVANGIASYAMNYFRHIDKKKIHIDFLIIKTVPTLYYEEIEKQGHKVYIMPPLKNINGFLKTLKGIFKEERYDIVHCHVLNTGIPVLYFARKYKVKFRILHSHVTQSSDKKINQLRNSLLIPISKAYSNVNFACSKAAGDYLFPNKKVTIINNAIDIEKYLYDQETRIRVRNKLNIDNKFVIGCVGRLAYQKNPQFALRIFVEILKREPQSILLWIGTGPLDNEIKKLAEDLGIQRSIKFLGNRSDVNELYQAMDVFLLPSIYEGLGIVFIEAQASGLHCFASDAVPNEAKVTDLLHFMSLEKSEVDWANEILKYNNGYIRKRMYNEIVKAGYEIKTAANKLEEEYIKVIN